MTKLVLVLTLVLFGCATTQATRTVLNCQSEPVKDSKTLFIGGSKNKDEIECKYVQVPIAPKATPIQAPAELVK
jgi:outer membrane PBP1 activator LpoA protein